MIDPGLAIQDRLEAILRASEALADLMGGGVRLYTSGAPQEAPFPLIEIGDDTVSADETECAASSEVISSIRIWARDEDSVAASRRQSKEIASCIRALVSAIDEVPGFDLVLVEFRNTLHRLDGDARTAQAVMTFRFLLDPA